MRKFKLWNYAKNEAFDLNSKNHFMSDVKGLGLEYDLTFVETENGEYLDKRKIKNNEITSKLLFMVNPYQKIKEFTDFIYSNGNNTFILEYDDGIIIRNIDVHIQKLGKTEKNEFGVVESEFIMRKENGWYQEVVFDQNITILGTTDYYEMNLTNFYHNTSDEPIPLRIEYYFVSGNYPQFWGPKIEIGYKNSQSILYPIYTFDFKNKSLYLNNGNQEDLYTMIIDAFNNQIVRHEKFYDQFTNFYGVQDLTKNSFLFIPSYKWYRLFGNIYLRITNNFDTSNIVLHLKLFTKRWL